MSAARRLWTGPFAANLRDRAIEQFGAEALWIVPTPIAREQVAAALIRRGQGSRSPAVYGWDQLWHEIARRHARPPALLSDAAARAALVAAIDLAGVRDELGPLDRVAGLPGTRKALRDRFASWTRAERALDSPPFDDAITRTEWGIYRRYRKILAAHKAEDAAGLAVWASRAFRVESFGEPSAIVFFDPIAPSPAQLRVIDASRTGLHDLLVTLPTSGDTSGEDPAISPLRSELIEAGFDDEAYEPEHPTGLATIESSLFQDEPARSSRGPAAGLSILLGPQGEGLGLLLAREVRRSLDAGIAADDIVVLVRHWDDDASRALEILRSWEIPASGSGRNPLGTEPAIAALRLALSIPVGGWELTPLIRLLRNGQIGVADPLARAEAASVLQSLRTFRGLDPIRDALERASVATARDRDRAVRARIVIDRIATALLPVTGEAAWQVHVDRLRESARELALENLDALWSALDDQGLIHEFATPLISHATFVRDVEAILRELDATRPSLVPGTVRLLSVDEAEGVSARVIVLTNLAEGTFPSRGAVASSSDAEGGWEAESLAFARERLQFLHAIGAARDEAILLVPTTDPQGEELLSAGFVDDLKRLLKKKRGGTRIETLQRLDPSFRAHPELARSPADASVLAVARACLDRDGGDLEALCRNPERRPALRGAAAALRLVHERLRIRRFTEFDGLMTDDRLIARIAEHFGPDHTFSPSQFESFALCPFQFYQKHVLKLLPVDDEPELRLDRASRGERVHKALEELHAAIESEGATLDDLGRVEALIQTRMTVELDVGDSGPGEVAEGLRAIEDEVVRRTLVNYVREFATYRKDKGATAQPRHFEVRFGSQDSTFPELELGDAEAKVRLRGTIDRVDLIANGGSLGFRVIDYKTGLPPGPGEVIDALRAVQLPLYALAVERFLFADGSSSCDFGYWAVRRDGFKPITLKGGESWSDFRARVIDKVLGLAASLRRGAFPIDPTKVDCTKFCDYKTVCRIGQIRNVEKEVVMISPSS
jgi:ATP-dependent helicase/nuclease subunit B